VIWACRGEELRGKVSTAAARRELMAGEECAQSGGGRRGPRGRWACDRCFSFAQLHHGVHHQWQWQIDCEMFVKVNKRIIRHGIGGYGDAVYKGTGIPINLLLLFFEEFHYAMIMRKTGALRLSSFPAGPRCVRIPAPRLRQLRCSLQLLRVPASEPRHLVAASKGSRHQHAW
jgi:hypothetical protein